MLSPALTKMVPHVRLKEVVFELLQKESQNKQSHSFLGELLIVPCFKRTQEAVDIYKYIYIYMANQKQVGD